MSDKPRRVRASVPGKAILVGEHAAVYGSPALVAGVGLRLDALLETTGEVGVELRLPDLGHEEHCSFEELAEEASRARESWRRWQQGDGALPVVPAEARAGRVVRLAIAECVQAVGRRRFNSGAGLRITVRSGIPLGAGLGSSAAVAVAVASVVAAHADVRDESLIEAAAGEVEKRQHGAPSGVDVAAVLRGGVLRIVRAEQGLELESLSDAACERLGELMLYDSGAPTASTGEVVSAVRSLREKSPNLVRDAIAEIEGAEVELRAALEQGGSLLESVRRAHRALVTLGVVPREVQQWIAQLEQAGGAAKISGAGALEGPSAGLILALPAPGRSLPDVGSPWRRLTASLGAPGLRLSDS